MGDNSVVRSQQKILDATLRLIERGGFAAVNMAAVAHEAGVSRQTVYSNFGSREEVVSQAMGGLAVDVFGDIKARLSSVDTACEYLVEFIVAGRGAVRAHPVLMALMLSGQGNPVFDVEMMERASPFARELLSPMIERGLVTDAELDDIVEMGVRLGYSLIAFDSAPVHADGDLRAFLTRWLLPAMPVGL